jgi:hypothetical protein
MKISEFDFVFISYDEPNADIHYADLVNKIPWAKRVHGVEGSDAAHKEAAKLSDTDWFVTIDADNLVHESFFNFDVNFDDNIKVFSWTSKNQLNGLRYGNGGLKLWNKEYVFQMKSHENSVSENAQVDFCWEDQYRQFPNCFSRTVITGSPFQAWRAGFREGVKMLLKDGIKIEPHLIKESIWWHNLHRLKIWSTVGMHEENGKYAILGARMGTYMLYCEDWNYVEVRDFEVLRKIYETRVDHSEVEQEAENLGYQLKTKLGLDWPWLDSQQSKYTLDLYNETIDLAMTYYKAH